MNRKLLEQIRSLVVLLDDDSLAIELLQPINRELYKETSELLCCDDEFEL